MVKVVEIVLELEASEFINSGRTTRARVVRCSPGGELRCQVDDSVKGVAEPSGSFAHVDEARAAIIAYWKACNEALQNGHWRPRPTGF